MSGNGEPPQGLCAHVTETPSPCRVGFEGGAGLLTQPHGYIIYIDLVRSGETATLRKLWQSPGQIVEHSGRLLQFQAITNSNAPNHTLSCGTGSKVGSKGFLRLFHFFTRDLKVIGHSNLGYLKDAVHIFNVTLDFRPKTIFRSPNFLTG